MKNLLICNNIQISMSFPIIRLRKQINYVGLFILIISLLSTSCEYKLKSENFIDLEKPDTTHLMQLTLYPADTFYLFTLHTMIHYNLNTFGLKIYNVEVFMDDVSIYKGDQQEASFQFNPEYISPPGYKTMSLVVTTNTNTRSLADLTGYEGLVFRKEWRVYVDGGSPNAVNISRIFNDNGLLKLEWEPYMRPNFQKYRIWVHYAVQEWPDYDYMIGEVSDPNQDSWYDSSFVGGTPRYWIEVMASDQFAAGEKTRFEYISPKLQTLWQRGDSSLFSWNKHAFYRALARYTITTTGSYPYNQVEIFSSANANDTAVIMRKLRFGQALDYTLSYKARKAIIPRLGTNVVSDKITLGIGNLIPMSSSYKEVYGNPVLYLTYYDAVTKISFPSGAELFKFNDVQVNSWNVTPDDGLLFTWSGNTLIKHDGQSFSELGTFPISYPGIPTGQNISMKGTAIKWLDNGLGLYDFINGRYIFTGKNAGLYGAVISPDGNYTYTQQFLENNSIAYIVCQVTDTGMVEKWRISGAGLSVVKWLNEANARLLVTGGGQALPFQNSYKIYNPEDQSILYQGNLKNGAFGGIDPESGKLMIWDQTPGMDDKNKAYLYNYKSGALIHEFSLAPRFDNLFLYRSHLVSGPGYCLDISNF